MVKLTEHDSLSRETVRRRLAENDLKPWRKDMWCIPQVDGEYVARMEDVLDLYAEAPDPEAAGGLLRREPGPTHRRGAPANPGQAGSARALRLRVSPQRHGQSLRLLDVHRPWRKVKVTERRAAEDYAHCMRDLVDIHYPDAEIIRVVQDNLSTHRPAPCIRRSRPPKPGGSCGGSSSTYTPKHASWLNMVEIEIGVLRGQCLDRRIDDPKRLRREITAWERRRNAARSRIKWMFTTDKARAKMGRAYPATSKKSKSLC